MAIILTGTAGLCLWIVLWALNLSGLDGIIIAIIMVLAVLAVVQVLPGLTGKKDE